MIDLHPEFITKNGQKEFAVIPYEEFLKLQEILEDMEDLRDLKLAEEQDKNSPDYSLEEVKKMLDISWMIELHLTTSWNLMSNKVINFFFLIWTAFQL